MIEVYSISQSTDWDSIVKSFDVHDVFYLCGYPKAFQIHGDGDPFLLYYESNSLRAIYVYMRRTTVIEGVFDSITPYGYGGVLFEGDNSEENVAKFWVEYEEAMRQEHIADSFVRYHPILRNAIPMKSVSCIVDLGKTIAFDLSSPEVIWENIVSKNRNMIRKAEKNGVEIRHGKDMALLKEFRSIYDATMKRDNAEGYYFFGESFYESLNRDLPDNYEVFYALYEGQIIAMSIILFANKQMHYHLSGSIYEYRNLAPSNLLLYKAALWGFNQGFKTFHLGGGVGSTDDNLYKFKAAFNKNSDYRFSIGKDVFDQDIYDKLVEIRRRNDPGFDDTSAFFPLYRA